MTMNVSIKEPNGQKKELNDIAEISNLFLMPNPEYWLYGSGDMGIYVQEPPNPILILVYSKEKNGFFVQLYPKKGPDDWWVAVNDSQNESLVSVYVGGNKTDIPSNVVISCENTFRIVEHFMANATTWDGIGWKSYWDIDWPVLE